MINGSRGDLYARRSKCRYCPRTYAFTTGRDKHMQAKHRNEMIHDGLIKLESPEPELGPDYIAPVEATPITTPHGPECVTVVIDSLTDLQKAVRDGILKNDRVFLHDSFASTAGHICQDPEAHEKAAKWDRLVRLLPLVERLLKYMELDAAFDRRSDV